MDLFLVELPEKDAAVISACETLSQEPRSVNSGLLIHEHCEIRNLCCFRLLDLW